MSDPAKRLINAPSMDDYRPYVDGWEPGQGGAFLTTVDKAIRLAQTNSIWPLTFGLACCAIEMLTVGTSRWDIARFGAEVYRATPRQADVMIVAGRLSWKMAPVIRELWEQMPHRKWCISMGACASCGGVFQTYSIVNGVDQIVPVDIYIPGCPPRPEALLDALVKLQNKIRSNEPKNPFAQPAGRMDGK